MDSGLYCIVGALCLAEAKRTTSWNSLSWALFGLVLGFIGIGRSFT